MYATASSGFRSGGENEFAAFLPGEGVPSSFSPETLWNYELGWKTRLADGRLTFNGAVFYMDWDDIQVGVESTGPFQAIDNVSSATTQGVEWEFIAVPIDGLDLSFGGAYIEAEVAEDITDGVFAGVEEGTPLPGVPDWSLNGTAQYRFPITARLGGVARIDGIWVDESARGLGTGSQPNSDYEIINVRAGVEGDNWEIVAFVKNVTDSVARARHFSEFAQLNLAAPTPFNNAVLPIENTVPGHVLFVNRPRTVGVTVRLRF